MKIKLYFISGGKRKEKTSFCSKEDREESKRTKS